MGLRQRQFALGLPRPQIGVIGLCRITTNGTSITRVERFGCISGVTQGASAVFDFAVWPPQPFYTLATGCTYSTNATFGQGSFTAASITPRTFQIQMVGVNPIAGVVPPTIWITVFGFIKTFGRGNRDAVNGTPHGPLDVIGMALYSTTTGTVTLLRTYGCVKNVRFNATAVVDVDIWPAQAFYTVCGMASNDATSASWMAYPNSAPPTSTTLRAQTIGLNPVTGRNAQLNTITIFGFRKPYQQESAYGLPKPNLGVLGISRCSITGTGTNGLFTGYGNIIKGYAPAGSLSIDNNIFPVVSSQYPSRAGASSTMGCYTCFGLCSSDLAVATVGTWVSSLSAGATPSLTSIGASGSTGGPWGYRTCQVEMCSVFGPLT